MKKITFLIFALLAYQLISYGQEDVSLDQMLVNVNQSSVTSGIIYEREAPFADLYEYNSKLDTADIFYFEQAESELYNASNQTKFISNDALRLLYTPSSQTNVVDIGILNSQYQILNYDASNPSLGGLTLSNNLFSQINGKPPFLSSSVIVIAPLKDNISGMSFTYNFKSGLWLTNGAKTIKTVTADVGDGVARNVIINGSIASPTVTVTYSQSGYKYLKFTVTYSDNSTHVTYGKIYANVLSGIKPNYAGEVTQDFTLTASIPFQGYDETAPTPAFIQYRVFYRTDINTGKKLTNPIIVSDGFDPGDKRKIEASDYINYVQGKDFSIEDMMTYTDCDGITSKNLIQILNQKGYDVVIVNYPTYISSTTGKEVNGGADFIERNAMAMVSLIQSLNASLAADGSTAQLVVVGPSMGGQITRYALAYMEKQYAATGNSVWLHKTRLWISIDSPHLGANIPEGLQALINLLSGSSPQAHDFYTKQLGSPAAKQQLINWHQQRQQGPSYYYDVNTSDLNGRTISQGWPTNSGSPFYQQFYNNQFANGLSNSKGYPMNLRKIALVNGSVTGKTYGTDGQQTLNINGFINVCLIWCGAITVASMETYTMPAYGTDHTIAFFQKKFRQRHTHAPNNDTRGNPDILPGGAYSGYDILAQSVVGSTSERRYTVFFPFYIGFTKGSVFYNVLTNNADHCFIPTFSSLGMKNPSQDWAQSLKRNLVCSNEIPFDSYFGHDDNTKHTSFDCQSVAWLLKEVDGTPQAPWFPLTSADLSGPATLCLNDTKAYSFASLCSLPSAATWSISSNLQPINFTSTSITVKAVTGGSTGTITATFTNGEQVVKTINVGAPTVYASGAPYGSCNGTTQTWSLTASPALGSNWNWYPSYRGTGATINIRNASSPTGAYADVIGGGIVSLSYTDICGVAQNISGPTVYSSCQGTHVVTIIPNPAKSQITISTQPLAAGAENELQTKNSVQNLIYVVKITDRFGVVRKTLTYKQGVSSKTIAVADLNVGTYVVSIFDGKYWSSQKLLIQK